MLFQFDPFHRNDDLFDSDCAVLIVDCRSDPFTRPTLEELPNDDRPAALVEQRDGTVQPLGPRLDNLLASLPKISAVGKTSLENDVRVFSYAGKSADRNLFVAFAVLNDVSLAC